VIILPQKLVDYDTILSLQTLSWEFYDTEINFDLANHIDCDVHISLLYDVQEEEPEDYTGIRVGYPADADNRIGFLTPPGSPRKFKEETVDELVAEASHQYIGDIEISPIGTDKGIKQTLSLKNPTSVSTLSVIDSPIMNEMGKIFDATEWIDKVDTINIYTSGQKHLPLNPLYTFFDKHYFFDQSYDEVYFDYEKYIIEGLVFFHYRSKEIRIHDYRIDFYGGLDPESYEVYGIGESSTNSNYISIYLYQDLGRKTGMSSINRKGSLRLHLLVSRTDSRVEYDPYWTYIEYGFGEYTYMSDLIESNVGSYITSSLYGIPIINSLNNPSVPILSPINFVDSIHTIGYMSPIAPLRTISGIMVRRTTGSVFSAKISEDAHSNPYTYYQLYLSVYGIPNVYPNDFSKLISKSIYLQDSIESSIDYKITPILTQTNRVSQASW